VLIGGRGVGAQHAARDSCVAVDTVGDLSIRKVARPSQLLSHRITLVQFEREIDRQWWLFQSAAMRQFDCDRGKWGPATHERKEELFHPATWG
jgi:hypothetical protein